jgi:hypothetical protein
MIADAVRTPMNVAVPSAAFVTSVLAVAALEVGSNNYVVKPGSGRSGRP